MKYGVKVYFNPLPVMTMLLPYSTLVVYDAALQNKLKTCERDNA